MKAPRSPTRHRRNEHDGIALVEPLVPIAKLRVDCDAQHLGREREGIASFELMKELARRAGRRDERLGAASGLLPQQGVILDVDFQRGAWSVPASGGGWRRPVRA